MRNTTFDIRNMDYKMWNMKFVIRKRNVWQIVNCRLHNKLPAICRLSDCELRIANYENRFESASTVETESNSELELELAFDSESVSES